MSFKLSVFFLMLVGIVLLVAYAAICAEDKKLTNPLLPHNAARLTVASVFATGIVTLVICMFNLYIEYGLYE